MPIPPRTQNFAIAIRYSGPASLVDVSGSLTSFEAGALRDAICGLIAKKRNDIVLNLGGLEYLDSSGIGELVRNYLTVIKSGGTMKVVNEDGTSEMHPWETGKAYWLPASEGLKRHADQNQSAKPIKVMVVELKKAN